MKILQRVCCAICSMLPMIVPSKSASRRASLSSDTRYSLSGRCKAFRTRRYSGAGTAFQRVQSPDKARRQSGRYSRLSARQGWISPRWNPQRGRTVPPRTRNCPTTHGRGQLRCFEYGPVGGLYAHHADIFRHTVLHLGCPCQVAMDHADIVLVLFHGFYQLRWPGLRRGGGDMDSLSSSSDRGTGFLREDSSHLSSSSR